MIQKISPTDHSIKCMNKPQLITKIQPFNQNNKMVITIKVRELNSKLSIQYNRRKQLLLSIAKRVSVLSQIFIARLICKHLTITKFQRLLIKFKKQVLQLKINQRNLQTKRRRLDRRFLISKYASKKTLTIQVTEAHSNKLLQKA